MSLKLSALAQGKIIERVKEHEGEAIWMNPNVTFYWDHNTEKLTSLLLPEEREFNEVEKAIIDYYENQLERIETWKRYVEKYSYENAKFRILGESILKDNPNKELEDLVYRNNQKYPGPTGEDAVKEAKGVLQRLNDSSCNED